MKTAAKQPFRNLSESSSGQALAEAARVAPSEETAGASPSAHQGAPAGTVRKTLKKPHKQRAFQFRKPRVSTLPAGDELRTLINQAFAAGRFTVCQPGTAAGALNSKRVLDSNPSGLTFSPLGGKQ